MVNFLFDDHFFVSYHTEVGAIGKWNPIVLKWTRFDSIAESLRKNQCQTLLYH